MSNENNKNSVLVSAILVSTNSYAEEVYFSATLGKSTPENTDHFNDGTGVKLSAGYRASKHFAVEGSYIHLGEFDMNQEGLDEL